MHSDQVVIRTKQKLQFRFLLSQPIQHNMGFTVVPLVTSPDVRIIKIIMYEAKN